MTPTYPADEIALDQGMPNNQSLWEMRGDLATVSCYAATEIDNLLLGRPGKYRAVRRLMEILNDSLISVPDPASPRSLMDPSTAVAMSYALLDADPEMKVPFKTITEVITEAKRVWNRLAAIVKEEPGAVPQEELAELERLRSLCLALSDRALAFDEPLDEPEVESEEP